MLAFFTQEAKQEVSVWLLNFFYIKIQQQLLNFNNKIDSYNFRWRVRREVLTFEDEREVNKEEKRELREFIYEDKIGF